MMLTFFVISCQVPSMSVTLAVTPRLPFVPTSWATFVTSAAKMLSWRTFAVSQTSKSEVRRKKNAHSVNHAVDGGGELLHFTSTLHLYLSTEVTASDSSLGSAKRRVSSCMRRL